MSTINQNLPTNEWIPLCHCGRFLLYNFYFKNKRFLCISCGALYAYPSRRQESTPEGEARLAALETEFLVNCGRKLFCLGMYRRDCTLCNGPGEQEHLWHASKRDWIELSDALKWISDRTGKEFAMVNGDLGHYKEMMSVAKPLSAPGSIEML